MLPDVLSVDQTGEVEFLGLREELHVLVVVTPVILRSPGCQHERALIGRGLSVHCQHAGFGFLYLALLPGTLLCGLRDLLGQLKYFEDFFSIRETRGKGKVSPERGLDGWLLGEEKRTQVKHRARPLLWAGVAMQEEEIEDVSI